MIKYEVSFLLKCFTFIIVISVSSILVKEKKSKESVILKEWNMVDAFDWLVFLYRYSNKKILIKCI